MVEMEREGSKRMITSKSGCCEKIIKKRKINGKPVQISAEASEFMSVILDDLLNEILIRLPDFQSIIRCSTVCKRWFSLLSQPQFVRNFAHHHKDYYIYNPLTGQLVALPQAPTNQNNAMCALVLDCTCNKSESRIGWSNICPMNKFRLLQICTPRLIQFQTDSIFNVSIYCSETGQWTEPIDLLIPFRLHGWRSWFRQAVVSDRVAYWLLPDEDGYVQRIVAFDPFKGTDNPQIFMRLINLPVGFGRGWRTMAQFVRLGLVQGRLRMSRLTKVRDSTFNLKVWELIYSDHDDNASSNFWLLVHDVKVNMKNTFRHVIIAFHPENGDVIFLLNDFDIYQYEIGSNKFEKVFNFSFADSPYTKWVKRSLHERLHVFPLVRFSLGPTQIPMIPASI
ncbi:hypothetical protein L484_003325 [Morus notabilis]|uniref:Uncharacterized protein n=1 Tax=Morus notabilis TaxID=981085 RepID=W9RVQ1_9ROSA|nr:hypothetical protein L484_003325 [Morus notabilis]